MNDTTTGGTVTGCIWKKIKDAICKNLGETASVVLNLVIVLILIYTLNWAWQIKNIWWIAVSAGGLGGLAHEFAQSKGKILIIKNYDDGLYLGSIAGIILGFVAGILVLNPIAGQSTVTTNMTTIVTNMTTTITTNTTTPNLPTAPSNLAQVAFGAFTAGLALKGVTDATTSNPQPKKDSKKDTNNKGGDSGE